MGKWDWICTQPEGQFLERKTCFDYSGKRRRRRPAKEVAKDVAETLAAMANADGGTLVLGIEDDGTPTGVPSYSEDRLRVILDAPRNLVKEALSSRTQWVEVSGVRVLVFQVDWSPEVHQLSDGRYLLRVGDQNLPFPADQIEAIKVGKRRRFTEARFVQDASLSDLDPGLLDKLGQKAGLNLPPEKLLVHYRIAEQHGTRLMLTLAALLLFAKDPLKWYPSCYVDFVKWEGTERRFGPELNVIKRERIEGPIPMLIERTFEVIKSHIRERQVLVDLFFEERFEYPTFAWQEAIINAVAHRDYALEGTPIEVWMFDDRLEVRSPGVLVEPVTIELLKRRERIHASRNPKIVRVLTEFGYMRELGEGIPRMFEVMEREGLHPPEFRLEAGAIFTVVLRNVPVYPPETARWLRQFEDLRLNPNQKRLLAYAYAHNGRFTSRQYQKLVGIDLYTASRDIKDLIRKGIARLTKKGGRIYEILQRPGMEAPSEAISDLKRLAPLFAKKEEIANRDVREAFGLSRKEALKVLQRLVEYQLLERSGSRRGTRYHLTPRGYDLLSRNYDLAS